MPTFISDLIETLCSQRSENGIFALCWDSCAVETKHLLTLSYPLPSTTWWWSERQSDMLSVTIGTNIKLYPYEYLLEKSYNAVKMDDILLRMRRLYRPYRKSGLFAIILSTTAIDGIFKEGDGSASFSENHLKTWKWLQLLARKCVWKWWPLIRALAFFKLHTSTGLELQQQYWQQDLAYGQ